MAQAPKLELRGVVVKRGAVETLRVDEVAVSPGEVLAIIGPNGAGKSTLLQVAGLVLKPAEGEVLFDGEAVRGDALPYRRRIAMALQEALLLEGSVLENVALGLKLRGVGKKEREATAREWLARFGIEALAKRRASKISGGEAQRASLARAFALQPELLLLDEPFSGLDEPTRQALLDDLAAVLNETGVATIFVTHDRHEAMRLADRVAVVLGGRLRQWATAGEVFSAPADEEVAAFVGVENIIAGQATETRDGLVSVDIGGATVFAVNETIRLGPVRVLIRPEDIVVQPPAEWHDGSARNLLPCTVRDIRLLGPQARLFLDCRPSESSQPFTLVATVTRLSVEEMALDPGSPVAASFKATAVHLLQP